MILTEPCFELLPDADKFRHNELIGLANEVGYLAGRPEAFSRICACSAANL